MLRFGAKSHQIRPMEQSELDANRLKLLIIMVKAYLEGCPIGRWRKLAVRNNASQVSGGSVADTLGPEHLSRLTSPVAHHAGCDSRQVFEQRVQLLTVAAREFTEGHPVGRIRRKAAADNLAVICQILGPTREIPRLSCLRTG